MKTKLITTVCALALVFGGAQSSFASEGDSVNMVADIVLVRPACLVATAAGSVFFVIALPIAAISKSTKKAANALVVQPAKATFTRPLGDMNALKDY
jgi:hypothetical protein